MTIQKRKDDPFGYAPLARTNSSTLAVQNKPLTRSERHSIIEYRQQMRVQELQARKTEIAQRAMEALHISSVAHFINTAETIDMMRSSYIGTKWSTDLVERYTDGAVQQAGAYINEATRAGANRILDEVNRSLYRETQEEKPGVVTRFEEWLLGT